MRLRFLCSRHRNWLRSDSVATYNSWQGSYSRASVFLEQQDHVKAVNHAGCALEAAELLLFTHTKNSQSDIHRFTDSAVLLCRSLIQAGEARLACGVIGGTIARLEELLFSGIGRSAVLEGCQQLLTVGDDTTLPQGSERGRIPQQDVSLLSSQSLH